MCTRAIYRGLDDIIITVRSMDWSFDMGTNLWAFPRGMKRVGAIQPDGLEWTSKYGSVVATGYESGTADGMNEAGLVANLLYLTESDYGDPAAQSGTKPALSISEWAQYVLDSYPTVAKAVKALAKEPFFLVTVASPEGKAGTVHLALSDATGDSAILEYVNGKQVIHHGPEFRVMTNSPVYDEQLALNRYWEQIGGLTMLPGTNRAADRFARASFYMNAAPETADIHEATATAFSIIRNTSVPRGISTPDQPNIATTLWRTVSDHKNRRYYYESTLSPSVFWVDLDDMSFKPNAPVRRLSVARGEIYSGNVADRFETAEPFAFLGTTL